MGEVVTIKMKSEIMISYRLHIHTNAYTGNFSREMTAYVFGWSGYNDSSSTAEKLSEIFLKEEKTEESVFDEMFEYFYDEYGQTVYHLSGHVKDEGTQDVVFHFKTNPWRLSAKIKDRLRRFPKAWMKIDKFADKRLKILTVSLVVEETHQKTVDVMDVD